MSGWPEELDALNAPPEYHSLLLENEQVRVVETRIPAGNTVPVHTHRWPSVLYILSWSDFVRRDNEGAETLDTRRGARLSEESAVWSSPPGRNRWRTWEAGNCVRSESSGRTDSPAMVCGGERGFVRLGDIWHR